eukprot:scaffold84454_cov20-Tisochrysis_lutea.AAC.1
MIFDFYQQRTKEDAPFVGGWASNFSYDFEMLGATCGLELDYIPVTGWCSGAGLQPGCWTSPSCVQSCSCHAAGF